MMPGAWAIGGAVAAIAAIGGLVALGRWLESHTLRKCVLLSVVVHVVLVAVVAMCGGLRSGGLGGGAGDEPTVLLALDMKEHGLDEGVADEVDAADTAEGMAGDGGNVSDPRDDPPPESSTARAEPQVTAEPQITAEPPAPQALADAATEKPPGAVAEPLPERPALSMPQLTAERPVAPADAVPPADHVPLLELPAADAAAVADAAEAATPSRDAAAVAAVAVAEAGAAASMAPSAPAHAVPEVYADRAAGRRTLAAAAWGGTPDTERAVQAALEWLAAAQSQDGRWDAARHGAGVERAVQGHQRSNAGLKGDHGVTGLALLAFLGAGNTPETGRHADTVARGLRFLRERQRADGSLAGDADFFAALYSHGMASIAVAEAVALTGDPALRQCLDRAVGYSLAVQHPVTGGWRYTAGDRGDTSQLGWQLMLLASARHAGLPGLDRAEALARSFLATVSSGRAGGLAAYRPGERPTAAMTAEAAYCRMLLGTPADHPAIEEALASLARSPPDPRHPNAYAWYYATLASFHAGGPQWDAWNGRLQQALLPLQRREAGSLAGSWDPDPVWGGHGGRVYSTALSAMTLEVYYRHLPMHRRPLAVAASSGSGAVVGR